MATPRTTPLTGTRWRGSSNEMGLRSGGARLVRDRLAYRGRLVLPPLPKVRAQPVDAATAVTLGYLTGGVALTLLLHRRGLRQMCQVARNPLGAAAWVLFTLHLWVPRFDPVRLLGRLR